MTSPTVPGSQGVYMSPDLPHNSDSRESCTGIIHVSVLGSGEKKKYDCKTLVKLKNGVV